jgi:hypothetical protein
MVKLSAMILPSIFLPSVHWMSWRNWICAKRQASVFGIKLIIIADSVFIKSVEKIVRIVLMGQQ